MNTKSISTIIGIILILSIGGYVYASRDNDIKLQTPTTNSNDVSLSSINDCGNGKTDCIGDESGETDDLDDNIKSSSPNTPTSAKTTTSTTALKSYTSTDVSAHNGKSSCWSIVNGNVYDLTSWIPQHPGGERAILSICGVDGSTSFNGQHGGSSKIASILAGFKIGVAK